MLTAITFLLTAATSVLGHGYVQEVKTSAGTYSGYLPWSDPYTWPAPPDRIIRKIPGNGPVVNVSHIDIQCNGDYVNGMIGSAPAALYATAAAGSTVYLNWTEWPDSHKGPVMTYMAKAPSDVTKWSPGNAAVWFKVQEQGLVDGTKWAATDILTGENHGIASFKIPASLKAGQYLVRHELLALHGGFNLGEAQFYPSCIQINVTGSGTKTGPSQLVSFPGAYKPEDPGIHYNIYGGNTVYPIRG